MAEVYEVQDPASGERLALKLLVLVQAALMRFNREYEAMTRLNHPGIVRVYHYGLHQGHPWLTMELLRGVPVQSYVKRVGRPGSRDRTVAVLRVGYHLAKALHYVHDRGLVHRDLKSANVLVLPDDRVKLVDFGAAFLHDAMERITAEGEFVGTFAYAAPEQLLGQPIDHKVDLYAFGVLLYRLLTGKRPFHSEDPHALARQHIHQPAPDPRTIVPGLSDGIVSLVSALLTKKPEHRPATADHVAQELERLAGRPFETRSRLAVHAPVSAVREQERRQFWRRVEDGPAGDLLVVEGDAGSDRVRFLESVPVEATARGIDVYRCEQGNKRSLQRLVETLLQVAADCPTEAAQPLIRTLRDASVPESNANPGDRARVRQAAAALARLRTRGDKTVLLIVLEVQLADPLELELLAGLRRALQQDDAPFKLVVSAGSSDLQGVAELARRLGGGWMLPLNPLSPRDVALAVGNMLGRRPPTAELSRRLHAITAGQPLYLEEAVRDMVVGGGIEADGNRLAWADQAMDLPVPARAQRTADRQLEKLPVVFRRVLEALVVVDASSDATVLARVLEWRVPEVVEVLQELDRRGVLRWDPQSSSSVEWRQPMLATALARCMNPCRRQALRRGLVRALAGRKPVRSYVEAMVSSGVIAEAASAAVAVATEDVAHHRVRNALDVLTPVVAGAGPEFRGPDFAELFLLHSRCLRAVHPTDPASMRSLARARLLAELDGDRLRLARIALAQARLNKVIGHYGNFAKYLAVAWEAAPEVSYGGGLVRAAIATEQARSFRWRGDVPKAEMWVERALSLAEATGDRSLVSHAVVVAAGVMQARGAIDDAEQALSKAMQDFERVDDQMGFWLALARWSSTLRLQGRYSEALSQLYQRLPDASQSQDATPYVELLLATAWIELELSRLGRAQECTDELTATVHRGEHLHLRLESQLLTGRILLSSGQIRSAGWTLQEVHRSARRAELPTLAEHARALWAETLYALGDREQGRALFQSAILGLLGGGDLTVLMEGCRSRARTEATERDPDEIFRPIEAMLASQPLAPTRLEQLLARGAWLRSRGQRHEAQHALREAAMVLNRVAARLNDTDRAALRVHPWSRWIRRGLSA